MLYLLLSRIFAPLAAALLLLILSPLLLVLALVLSVELGSLPLFRQQRPGYRGKPFYLVKFKTMTDAVDANGELLPDDDRLTKVGSIVRKLSLDELPQLWNIVAGDMAFIGPRPLLMEYLPLYNAEQARRHDVLPGLTGWAQVNGRNRVSWQEKFALDVYYVEHAGWRLDIEILARTISKVLRARDVNDVSGVGMSKFTGNGES